MTAPLDVKKLAAADLRGVVIDSAELKKGTELFDRKALSNFARYENKLFCEAKGSDPAPYRVTLTFGDGALDVKARCTCPRARAAGVSFCKHAAALLVAWSRAPEAFVQTEAPAAG